MTVVGVGHALADAFSFVEDDVPKTLGLHPGSFNQVPDYRMRAILRTLRHRSFMAGGSAANTVKLAARLGLDTHFVGQCGHDEPGQTFESELLQAGVKVNLARSDAPTGLCVTLLTPGQGRTVATFRAASGDLAPGLLGDTLLAAADWLVLEGYLLDEPRFLGELAPRCAQKGKAICFDVAEGSLVEHHRVELRKLLALGVVRFLFLPEPEAADLTDLDPGAALNALNTPETTVVLKRPEGGWLVQEAGKPVEIPWTATQPVDATGADDGFQAGFLWAMARGWTLTDACLAGSLVAGCVVEEPGTRVADGRWGRLVADLKNLVPSVT